MERVLTDLEADTPHAALPSGDPLDLYPGAPEVRRLVEDVASVGELIEVIRATPRLTEYRQEALVHAWLWGRAGVPDDAHDALEEARIGIVEDHPLRDLRDDIAGRVAASRSASTFDTAVLWGASVRAGKQFYREAGILLDGRPGMSSSFPLEEIVLAWARSSGVRHATSLATLRGMVQTKLLDQQDPPVRSAKLSAEMMELAVRVAPGNPLVQLAFFRCLQRVAAYQVNGQTRWWATWLRGEGTNKDAIPGASTHGTVVRELLREHVFARRVAGHQAGSRAATYELMIPITTGPFSDKHFADYIGISLAKSGKPRRSGTGRARASRR